MTEAILESYDDINVVTKWSSTQDIIDKAPALAMDVLLLDLKIPGVGELSTTEILLERRPDTRILILSMHDSAEYISSALGHGAMGYVLKDGPTEEIR